MKLTMWLKERELNARRLAAGRTGADRSGWLEDADYFEAAGASVAERDRLLADNALLNATEQRLRTLLGGADNRAVANGKEREELAAQAADVAGERAANAALTAELEQRRGPMTDFALLDMAAEFRSQYQHGGITFDTFDAPGFARAVEAAHGIGAA